jgi:hypothetical protein
LVADYLGIPPSAASAAPPHVLRAARTK